eukprot:523206_1
MTTPRKSTINHIYKVGDCVEISQRRVAIIKYIGKLQDMRGVWYGIEFIDGSVGSHAGLFKNIRYFHGSDKRCEFIQKGDIRRKLKQKSNSTRNIHSKNNTLLNSLYNTHDNINEQPMLALQNHVNSHENNHIITLKLRCMCFADPIPIELKIDINNHTMLYLKQQIINQCNNNTNLPLFKSIINNKKYSQAIDLYQLTMNINNNNNNNNNDKGKSTRINNLNVKPGNMAYCILKKNTKLFTKVALNNNNNNNNNNDKGKSTRINNLNVKPGNMAYCILKKNTKLFTKVALNNNNNNNNNNDKGKSTRINNLNVKPGNMAYCILKKNTKLFTKVALNNNNNNNNN